MASKKFEKGSQEWDMFQDYWKLCQEFWEPEETDEFWEKFIEKGNEFLEKYKGNAFANKLFWAFHDVVEQKLKEIKNK